MIIITPCGRYQIEIDADIDERSDSELRDNPRIHYTIRDLTIKDGRPFEEKAKKPQDFLKVALEGIIASGFVSATTESYGQTVDLPKIKTDLYWEKNVKE